MLRKKLKVGLLLTLMFLNVLFTNYTFADDQNDEEPLNSLPEIESLETSGGKIPRVPAGAAIVMDTESGRILYEKNAYKRSSIASTTKIMTAIVALENGNENEDVLVSKRAASISGSTVDLKEGDTYKLGDLFYALMLRSGNDAAIAIAEHVGGSVEAFAEMMNRKAAEIGAANTNFVTPHGLDDPQHYSTPYDLAIITRYALKNEKFNKIVGTRDSIFEGGAITNTNEMLRLYPGADGVKTGYTGQAGRCLVTSATQEGWRVISVVLNCATRAVRAQASKTLLDYTFNNFDKYSYLTEGQQVSEVYVKKGMEEKIPVYTDCDVSLPLKQDEIDELEIVYNIPRAINAPVDAYSRIGTISYVLDGKTLMTANVITHASTDRKDFYYYFDKIFKTWARLVHQD